MADGAASAERTPLLRSGTDNVDTPAAAGRIPFRCALLTVIAPGLLLHAFFSMATTVIDVAMSELGEGILCRSRHGAIPDPANDPRCKATDVQSALSMLQAVELTFGLAPSILMSIPYASIADRLGRKFVLALSIFGMLCVFTCDLLIYRFPEIFSVYLIWPAALFTFIGGGPQVLMAITYTMFSDITPSGQRATIFFYFSAAQITGNLIGAPVAYATMARGVWVGALSGYSFYVVSFILALICQETLPQDLSGSSNETQHEQPAVTDQKGRESLGQAVIRLVKHTGNSLRCIFKDNVKLGILLISILFADLGSYASILLMQYMRKRFSWSWSEANLFLSIKTFTRLALVTVIMPLISQALTATKMAPVVRDARIALWSLLGTITGAFGIAAASSAALLVPFLALFALDDVYMATMHSLLALLAPQDAVATLFSVMGVLRALGMMIAGPSMAAAFRIGLNWGKEWVGLPFVVAGALMSIAAVIVLQVPVRATDQSSPDSVDRADSGDGEGAD
ncbi:hypothetical protein K4F52_007977 [Lecanicillium sp. MT-2017a]|nr:hypothetical protein K4F52_007977 [Lecanicillium sp. MT-2017a]